MGKWKVWLLIALGILGRLVAWALLGRNESWSMERQSPNQSLKPTPKAFARHGGQAEQARGPL